MDFATIADKLNEIVTILQDFQYVIGVLTTLLLANKKILYADFPAT